MRKLLATIGALTIASSTAVTVVACATSNNTTNKVFDWNNFINKNFSGNSTFNYASFLDLLSSQTGDSTLGDNLYNDLYSYTSLSVIKTSSIFNKEYQYIKLTIENDIKNIQDSLKAKFGRKWGEHWNNFLKDPAQGGNGTTGSQQRYFDVKLKEKAKDIVANYYTKQNFHNLDYYIPAEVSFWFNDIFNTIKNKNNAQINDLDSYEKNGTFKDKVWIVVKSFDQTESAENNLDTAIADAIKNNTTVPGINKYSVPKTDDNKEDGNVNYDYTSQVDGLLSDQQQKIAKLWLRNSAPVWARQIVVPFNKNDQGQALEVKINADMFSENDNKIKKILDDIKNKGFDGALLEAGDNIKTVSKSSDTGDLGLVTLNSPKDNINSTFQYYLYRAVTSEQGFASKVKSIAPFNIQEVSPINDWKTELIPKINREYYSGDRTKHSSMYNDQVYINDNENDNENKDKIFIFIDKEGIHFVKMPGLNYKVTPNSDPVSKLINDYTNCKYGESGNEISFANAEKLTNRIGGLSNFPYLSYLQTNYLVWKTNKNIPYYDLNSEITNFTSGSKVSENNKWWDYLFYFDNNINRINWNINVSSLLNTNINANQNSINNFIKSMKSWFTTAVNKRWSNLQGKFNITAMKENFISQNQAWDTKTVNAPVARLDADDLSTYITKFGYETIWWYDPNQIRN